MMLYYFKEIQILVQLQSQKIPDHFWPDTVSQLNQSHNAGEKWEERLQ